jgi:hypothetical protein
MLLLLLLLVAMHVATPQMMLLSCSGVKLDSLGNDTARHL